MLKTTSNLGGLLGGSSRFLYRSGELPLPSVWHYHPEIEMVFFTNGKIRGVLGEEFQDFEAGDLILMGEDFPHLFKYHSEFAADHPEVKPEGMIIQFSREFLGNGFFDLPEMVIVKEMLDRAKKGIRFGKKIAGTVTETLMLMKDMPDLERLISFVSLLVILSKTDDYTVVSSKGLKYAHHHEEERLQKVNEYIFQHFKEPISVHEIAAVAGMTETSFCRYFKNKTEKTFIQFLNEIRISYASTLLEDAKNSVSDACFRAGFNSLSYFNRQFNSIMGMSPMQYKTMKKNEAKIA